MSRRISAAAFGAVTPKTSSPAARSLRMKNETTIMVITGLGNSNVGKAERKETFWQLLQRESQIQKNILWLEDKVRVWQAKGVSF